MKHTELECGNKQTYSLVNAGLLDGNSIYEEDL